MSMKEGDGRYSIMDGAVILGESPKAITDAQLAALLPKLHNPMDQAEVRVDYVTGPDGVYRREVAFLPPLPDFRTLGTVGTQERKIG